MGSRDHSAPCDVCGMDRGGMNDLLCRCSRCEVCDREKHASRPPGDSLPADNGKCYRGVRDRPHSEGGRSHIEGEWRCDALRTDWRSRALTAEARVAELRALLGEARKWLDIGHPAHGATQARLAARIEAALKEPGS